MPGTLTELPKKKGKKPALPEENGAEQAPQTTTGYVKPSQDPFPPWPKGEGKGGYTTIEAVMQYWESLPPEFIARTNFYVNRDHPKLDRLQELNDVQRAEVTAKKRREPAKYIDKPASPWREKDIKSAFLRRYGSGDYKVFLNDSGATTREGKKNPETSSRNLCKAKFSIWDTDYPPVLDPSRPDKGLGILDWTFPANASYIADLRIKGILPPQQKEDADVQTDVVKTLVDQVGTLADKVAAHETDRLVDRIAEKVNPQGGNGGRSQASDIVDVLRAAKELNPAPPTAAPVAAPPSAEAQMSGVLGLVTQIMTMKADNPMVDLYKAQLDLMKDEIKAEREETRRLQKEIRDAAEKRQQSDGIGGINGIIDQLDKVAPKLANLLGLGGEKLTDVVHGRRRGFWEELALQTVPKFAEQIGPLVPMIASRFLTPNGAGLGMPAPNGAPHAALPPGAPPPAPDPLHVKVSQFLGSNLGPMQKAFQAYMAGEERDPNDKEQGKRDGTDFAAWVEEYHGEQYLKDFRALGSANILAMFKATPGLWSQLQPYEVQLTSFIDQVLSYELTPAEVPPAGPVDLSEEEED